LRPREALGASFVGGAAEAGPLLAEQGNVVWAKMKGYPPWPARVITREEFEECSAQKLKTEKAVCFQFFGTYEYGQTVGSISSAELGAEVTPDPGKPNACRHPSKPYDVWSWDAGVEVHFHLKYKSSRFRRSVAQAERYLSHNEIPDEMIPPYNDTVLDEEEEEDAAKPRKRKGGSGKDKALSKNFTVGKNLLIEDIGAIEAGDSRFHDEQYIFPLGFRSKRTVQSPAGQEVQVSCSIQRQETQEGGGPSFTVAAQGSDGGETISFTERSAPKAWQLLEENGVIKRQVYSGHKLFGYSVSRVQHAIEKLPGVEWLEHYSPLDEDRWKALEKNKTEEVAAEMKRVRDRWEAIAQCPKSLDFQAVNINLPPNRCAICHTDKETDQNQLIQCDSCLTVVHMGCYGVQEELDPNKVWLCKLCECLGGGSSSLDPKPACALCPCTSHHQILTRTTCKRWAHVACAIWIPETTMVGGIVDGVKKIRPARLQLKCMHCKTDRGACIQCSSKKCYSSAHPLCARQAGWTLKISEDLERGSIKFDATCAKCEAKCAGGPPKKAVRESFVAPTDSPTSPLQLQEEDLSEDSEKSSSAGPFMVESYRSLKKLGTGKAVPYVVSGARGMEARVKGRFRSRLPSPCSLMERLTWTRETVHQRLAAGRSSIHGWGAFARTSHKTGDFVVEYVGELVRTTVANKREAVEYGSKVGIGTYIFALDQNTTIDATKSGNMAQLLNHSCDPNCFSRQVGNGRVVLSAMRDIEPGEELTYDYRFSGDEMMKCRCGSASCRGVVNYVDNGHEENFF